MQFKNKNYANRGINLETLINIANSYYMSNRMCTVIKVPTPWKILWKNCNGYRLPAKVFPEQKAWLDYVGCIDGVPITFDAKECKSKTSFPLSNIHAHQMLDLQMWDVCKGKGFIIVYFTELGEMYLLTYEKLKQYWDDAEKGGRKSIPYKVFKELDGCYRIESNRMIFCDWIAQAKEYIGG